MHITKQLLDLFDSQITHTHARAIAKTNFTVQFELSHLVGGQNEVTHTHAKIATIRKASAMQMQRERQMIEIEE